jgi:putative Mn2+ efflux pump MntP
LHWLDWVSALLLLGFGLYLTFEFFTGLKETHGDDAEPTGTGWALSLNAAGISVAAWALAAEGLEILVVWLGVSLREGADTATFGSGPVWL